MGTDKRTGAAPIAKISIIGVDLEFMYTKFEWKSFVNGGYMIRARIEDHYFTKLQQIATQKYLNDGRNLPTVIEFQIGWAGLPFTEKRIAYLTALYGKGVYESGYLEFVAIDPPTWFLNAGNADGRHYRGKVSDVIRQVVADYAPTIELEITETLDYQSGDWWMMRQDPQTFIISLLEWSSSIAKPKSRWIVSSNDERLVIKQVSEMEGENLGVFAVNTRAHAAADILEWELLADNFLTVLQTRLYTQGISAVSGQYIDKITEPELTKINDERTPNKVNAANLTPDRAFKKPDDKDWATSILAVPELSGGELGIRYSDYIDGRSRNMFMDMLNAVMRLRVRVTGNHNVDSSEKLGASTCTLAWRDLPGDALESGGKNYFLSGNWIVYGFNHVLSSRRGFWHTDLYLHRLDFDAAAKELNPQPNA